MHAFFQPFAIQDRDARVGGCKDDINARRGFSRLVYLFDGKVKLIRHLPSECFTVLRGPGIDLDLLKFVEGGESDQVRSSLISRSE